MAQAVESLPSKSFSPGIAKNKLTKIKIKYKINKWLVAAMGLGFSLLTNEQISTI
jgi:hypothetical protein